MTISKNNQEKLFDEYAYDWWNKTGNYKLLHKLNPLRLEYILARLEIKNKKILDIGCGGGILSEELSKMGAKVTGIDSSIKSIKIAQKHAKEQADLWDAIFENATNHSIEMATKNYEEMKYKQALKYAFFEINSIKEDYLIAKGGKANPYTLMRYLETQMVLLNPIAPHFAQYCWKHHIYPVLSKSQNFGKECKADLNDQAWPTASAAVDQVAIDRLSYLKDTKSAIRVGFEAAKSGGKKKAKGGK